MEKVIVKTPAKINLFLKVIDRREDGYHNIETIFEKIDLLDTITIEKKPCGGIEVFCNKEIPSRPEDNLVYKAAKLFSEKSGISIDVNIKIKKSIPVASGLGGGSSDAAATLLGINSLYKVNLSETQLIELGKILGADVPFFISNSIWAIGKERGDLLGDIRTDLKLWHILLIPPTPILSREVYKWVDRKDSSSTTRCVYNIDKVLFSITNKDVENLGKNLYNELEFFSLERLKLLRNIKERLIEYGARGSAISGSGPALFGICKTEREVMSLKERLQDRIMRDWQIFVCPTFSSKSVFDKEASEIMGLRKSRLS